MIIDNGQLTILVVIAGVIYVSGNLLVSSNDYPVGANYVRPRAADSRPYIFCCSLQ